MNSPVNLAPSRRTQVVEILEAVCNYLELSPSQFALAKQRYEGVAAYLIKSGDPLLRALIVNLQGSVAHGTTVKPIGVNEHDVDLVAHVSNLDIQVSPAALKKAIGDCLRANGNYTNLLEEKARCWRLNYANEFHLDITPSIRNPTCSMGGELVPDHTLRRWKASNPMGYRRLFEGRAKLLPTIRLRKSTVRMDSVLASVEPYPEAVSFRGLLRRLVQIAKRHRDIHFIDDCGLAPLSIIITTLASRSYEWCVKSKEYDDELEVLLDVVAHMPDTIEVRRSNGRDEWFIWNETTEGENFAEKWNADPSLARAFFNWHTQFGADLARFEAIRGLDQLGELIKGLFGKNPAEAVTSSLTERVSSARKAGNLFVAPAVGLTIGMSHGAKAVPSNTFFGNDG